MESIVFNAKSESSDDRYLVEFLIDGSTMKIKCNCKAGRFGRFCKHKMAFAQGNDTYSMSMGANSKLRKVEALVQTSDLLNYIIEISREKRKIEDAEERLKHIRAEVGKAMKTGFHFSLD